MPRLHVADEGVVGPAVPQAGDDVEELARAAIALGVLDVLLQPEIAAPRPGWTVVTMFQPARPPLIWSSEANRRAT